MHSSRIVYSDLSHLVNIVFLAVGLLVPVCLSLDDLFLRMLILSEEFWLGSVWFCINNT